MDPLPSLPSDRNHTGRDFGPEERELIEAVLRSGTLIGTSGTQVRAFEEEFAAWLGVRHALATSSGTAAVHAAIAAVDPEPGDEIVTTPITDMGALVAILYQNAIPVFADVDPVTLNVTPETVAARITPRTRAIVATHLFGRPCDMTGILAVAGEHGIPVIEDAAQAFGATHRGRRTGTMGWIGCFSLQQSKHITTGEGGLVVTNDAAIRRRLFLFVNKAWPYFEPHPDHEFLAPNYRMTELQAAVGRAQLRKLDTIVARRQAAAERFVELLSDVPGLTLPRAADGDTHSFWKMPLVVDPTVVDGGVDRVAERLRTLNVPSAPHYVRKPAYRCAIFRDRRTYGRSACPWSCRQAQDGRQVTYDDADFPGALEGLQRILVLPWNEHYTPEHVTRLAAAVREAIR